MAANGGGGFAKGKPTDSGMGYLAAVANSNAVGMARQSETAYAIGWAMQTGRVGGEVETKIRRLSATSMKRLVSRITKETESQNDVPRWLNRNLT